VNVLPSVRDIFPTGQSIRYLLVGTWNTLFGYALFASLTYLFTGLIPCAYLLASLLGNVVAVTVAFLGYKWFVFRTQGDYLREYLRCWAVYGTATIVGLVALPLLVIGLSWLMGPHAYVPYLCGALLTALSVLTSFLGHKHFSFAGGKRRKDAPGEKLVWLPAEDDFPAVENIYLQRSATTTAPRAGA
jgi:putative flippase GtrA